MKTITILGAGTSGLVSALILKTRFPNFKINIIKSKDVGIIGVGEGSTEHWSYFMQFCNIDYYQMIKETGATFKYGVLFKDWTKNEYLHSVNSLNNIKHGQYLSGYGYAISNNKKNIDYTSSFVLKNKIDITDLPNQYHFDTNKLNNFLSKICNQRGINIIEDYIDDIKIQNQNIKYIKGKDKYIADFYIDASGFKKILISKLGAKYISYKKYLPMNEAIAFQTKDTKEYYPYTLSKAMSAGWLWRIPVQNRWGNGYVFDNRYINAEQAKQECEDYLKEKITINKNIKFEAGMLDKFWIGNCCSIGLSSSFVEPMEASSIGSTIQQSFILMHFIPNYSKQAIERYNKLIKSLINNIIDFVQLHYLVKKDKSKFWKNLKIHLTDNLKEKLKIWKYRLPINEDFSGNYNLFYESNFTIILHALNLFDIKSIKNEYNSQNNECMKKSKYEVSNYLYQQKGKYYSDHKDYILSSIN